MLLQMLVFKPTEESMEPGLQDTVQHPGCCEREFSVISEALGHGNPNSVMIYLSTENAKLVECTLPLPGKEDTYAN